MPQSFQALPALRSLPVSASGHSSPSTWEAIQCHQPGWSPVPPLAEGGAAAEMPGARLFVVVNEHQGAMPADHPALDGLCEGAGRRAGEVVRIVLPRCSAPAWQAMVGMGKPLNEIATLRPQDLVPLGYRLGAAARSVSDVVEWLGEWRPQIRRILAAGGTVPPG